MSSGCQAICHRQLLKSIRNCLVEGKYDPFNDVEMIFEGDAGGMSVSSYLLALASPVLRAMRTSDMFEDKSTYNTHQTIIAARVTGPTWAAPAYL